LVQEFEYFFVGAVLGLPGADLGAGALSSDTGYITALCIQCELSKIQGTANFSGLYKMSLIGEIVI